MQSKLDSQTGREVIVVVAKVSSITYETVLCSESQSEMVEDKVAVLPSLAGVGDGLFTNAGDNLKAGGIITRYPDIPRWVRDEDMNVACGARSICLCSYPSCFSIGPQPSRRFLSGMARQ